MTGKKKGSHRWETLSCLASLSTANGGRGENRTTDTGIFNPCGNYEMSALGRKRPLWLRDE